MAARRWLENMIWCAGPLAFGLAAGWGMVLREGTIIGFALLGAGLHLLTILAVLKSFLRWAPELRLNKALPQPSPAERVGMILLYPVMLIGTCFGPLLYYAYLCRNFATGRLVPRSKTRRIPH